MALTTCTTNIEKVPCYVLAVKVDIEDVFGDAHGLDARMKNVLLINTRAGSALRRT